MQILPADDVNIHDLLTELSVNGLICRYKVEGKDFIQVTGWHHQVINRRAKESFLPPFTEDSRSFTPTGTKKAPPLPPQKDHPFTPPKEDSLKNPVPTEIESFLNDFNLWWECVPSKIGVGRARRAFKTALKKTDLQTLIAGIKKYAESVADNPEFIAHPATWLNGERWLDEPVQKPQPWRDL